MDNPSSQIFRIPFYNIQSVLFSMKKLQNIQRNKSGPFTGKKVLTENIPEEAQTLELLIKDTKLTVLNMLNKLKETMDKEPKEIGNKLSEQNDNIKK